MDVLNEELDDLEASWLPVVAAVGRRASRRRAQRRVFTPQENIQENFQGVVPPQMNVRVHVATDQQASAEAAMRAYFGPRVQFQTAPSRRFIERPLTWPPKLPLAPEPPLTDDEIDDISKDAPNHLVCPISLRIPLEPAISVSGTTYDRAELERAIDHDGRDPITYERCTLTDLRPNYALRQVLNDYILQKRHEKKNQQQLVVASSRAYNLGFDITSSSSKEDLTVRDLVRRLNTITPADLYEANDELAYDAPLPPQITLPMDASSSYDDDDDEPEEEEEEEEETTTRSSKKRKKIAANRKEKRPRRS